MPSTPSWPAWAPRPSRGADRPPADRSALSIGRAGPSAAGHSLPTEDIFDQLCRAAAGTGPHRRPAAGRHAGREPAGRGRPDDQRTAGRPPDGAYPCPRLPVAQRGQRHHDGPLAHRAPPDRTSFARSLSPRRPMRGAFPICASSTRPSSCSIPAAAAAPPARWSRPSTSRRTGRIGGSWVATAFGSLER